MLALVKMLLSLLYIFLISNHAHTLYVACHEKEEAATAEITNRGHHSTKEIDGHSPYLASKLSSRLLINCQRLFTQSDEQLSSFFRRLGYFDLHPKTKIVETPSGTQQLSEQSLRLLCIVYTHHQRHSAIQDIVNTWGGQCTGFLAFSNVADPSIPTVHIPHEGPESYDNIWHKVAAIWKYVYMHHGTEFDFFFISGDDVYMRVDAMADFLLYTQDIALQHTAGLPLYLGRRFNIDSDDDDDEYEAKIISNTSCVSSGNSGETPPGPSTTTSPAKKRKESLLYNGGGPGYILNIAALSVLAHALGDGQCSSTPTSAEDVNVANCLRLHGIIPVNTADSEGRDRFHQYNPVDMWYLPPAINWTAYSLGDERERSKEDAWWALHMTDYKGPGEQSVAPTSVTFHDVSDPWFMEYFHATLNCLRDGFTVVPSPLASAAGTS